jgi:hypothetical protein
MSAAERNVDALASTHHALYFGCPCIERFARFRSIAMERIDLGCETLHIFGAAEREVSYPKSLKKKHSAGRHLSWPHIWPHILDGL